MDASPLRTVLAIAAILAFAAAAFAGGYTFGLLSDGERTGASIQAASDFVASPTAAEAVSFRGCGEVRLRMPENASFSLAVTLSDASADARKTVTLTDADARSEMSGFRYASRSGRYQFDLRKFEGETSEDDEILAAELDGERVENDHRCAEIERPRTDASGERGSSPGTATTVGNAPTEDADPSTGANGGDEQGDAAGDDSSEPGGTDTDADTDADTDTAATPETTTTVGTETTTRTPTTVATAEPPPGPATTTEATTATSETATTSKATSRDES